MLTIEKLREYGADVNSGLQRCVNNEALYLRLTATLPKNEGFNNLYEAVKNNNLDAAFSAAHALKGIVLNLSISPLAKPINEITELLRNKTQCDYSKYCDEIEGLRKKLELLCE